VQGLIVPNNKRLRKKLDHCLLLRNDHHPPSHDKTTCLYSSKVFHPVYCFPHAICCSRMIHNARAGPWPELIMRSFFVAGASSAISEKPFYGSWNRLLTTLFLPDTVFEVVSQYFPPTAPGRDSVDFVFLLLIYVESSPVFIVEIKHPNHFVCDSNREEADLQLRRRFCDCQQSTYPHPPRCITKPLGD